MATGPQHLKPSQENSSPSGGPGHGLNITRDPDIVGYGECGVGQLRVLLVGLASTRTGD